MLAVKMHLQMMILHGLQIGVLHSAVCDACPETRELIGRNWSQRSISLPANKSTRNYQVELIGAVQKPTRKSNLLIKPKESV